MLIKLLIITICGVAAYAIAARYGLDGSKGLLHDPLTIALTAMAVAYGVVRLTLGPLAGPLEWAQPVVEIKTADELNALVAAAGEDPLLVDFYSPSCMPCRATAPSLNTLASEGRRVAVINVDEAHKLAWEYEVSAIPAMLVFRDGKVAKRAQGYHTAEGLRALIEG